MDKRHQSPHYHPGIKSALGALTLLILSTSAHADVEIISKGMTVLGQGDLPKVLYIVPWKRKDASGIEMPVTNNQNTGLLDPIDPNIFSQQLKYHQLMTLQVTQRKP